MRIRSIDEAREMARRALPSAIFNYVDGGKEAEQCARENEDAFTRLLFDIPVCPTTTAPNASTELFGTRFSMPLGIAPTGFVRIIHPDSELGAARAATRAGLPIAISTWSSAPAAEIVDANPACWFQLYMIGGREGASYCIDLARDAACPVLIVTADIAGIAPADRIAPPLPDTTSLASTLRFGLSALAKPRWLASTLRGGLKMPAPNAPRRSNGDMLQARDAGGLLTKTPFSWNDLAWVRRQWDGPLVLKGVMRASDAKRAVDMGVDGIIISNHGGKVTDSVPATLSVLSRIADTVGDRCEIIMDGGVRRGADIVKARAMGARAVLIGRPYLWGLAAGGEEGVDAILRLFKQSLLATLSNLDIGSIDQVGIEALYRE